MWLLKALAQKRSLNPTARPSLHNSSFAGLQQEKLKQSFSPSHSTACSQGRQESHFKGSAKLLEVSTTFWLDPQVLGINSIISTWRCLCLTSVPQVQEKHFALKLPWAELRAPCFSRHTSPNRAAPQGLMREVHNLLACEYALTAAR